MRDLAVRVAFASAMFVAFVGWLASPVQGAQGWERLGTRSVDFRGDVDTIAVGRSEGRFREIMFEVDGGTIELRNVRVVFGNGQDFLPPTRYLFADNDRSRIIDLPGQGRIIRGVTFNYRSLRTGQGRATVTLYGR